MKRFIIIVTLMVAALCCVGCTMPLEGKRVTSYVYDTNGNERIIDDRIIDSNGNSWVSDEYVQELEYNSQRNVYPTQR